LTIKLIVLRHGQTVADIEGRHEGRADFPLTELGEKQVKKSIERIINSYSIDVIISSPLKRAKQTATFLSEKCGIPLQVEPLVLEWDNGDLAGLKREDAAKLYPLPEGGRRAHHELANSESYIQFRGRAETFFSQLLEQYEDLEEISICIVSHGGFIQMLFRSVFKLPYETNHLITNGDGGFHVWEIEKEKRVQLELFPGHSV